MLEVKGLTCDQNRRQVLHDIHFALPERGIYSLMGPNGSGKSSLLKCIARIWDFKAEQLSWKGLPVHLMHPLPHWIAYVPAAKMPPFDYSVTDFVKMGRYFLHKTDKALATALQATATTHLAERAVTELSTGERQRVYVARALATEAPLLLLDEPTASLDIVQAEEIRHLLQSLKLQGKTLLVATHDLILAEHSDQMLLLQSGTLIHQGSFCPSTLRSTCHYR